MRSTQEFDLDSGDDMSKTIQISLPELVTPGDYYIQILLRGDTYHETTYRMITVG